MILLYLLEVKNHDSLSDLIIYLNEREDNNTKIVSCILNAICFFSNYWSSAIVHNIKRNLEIDHIVIQRQRA